MDVTTTNDASKIKITRSKTPIEKILHPFQEFVKLEASGGILLLLCIVVALLWANSPWSSAYTSLWQTKLTIGISAGFLLALIVPIVPGQTAESFGAQIIFFHASDPTCDASPVNCHSSSL